MDAPRLNLPPKAGTAACRCVLLVTVADNTLLPRLWRVALWLFIGSLAPLAVAEETFESLQVGANTYSNVTVISKNSTHVSITHAKGFASLRVKDLDDDLRSQLGYAPVEPPKPEKQSPLVQITTDPRVQEFQEQWNRQVQQIKASLDTRMQIAIGAGLFLLYLFYCYCCALICRKAGHEPGFMIWLPLLQLIPLLKAARMSPWNFVLLLLPLVGIVVSIIWCFKICVARRKSAVLGLFLLLPISSAIVFFYLAFADGQPEEEGAVIKLQYS